MSRSNDEILERIRANRDKIVTSYSVKRLALFGSHAREQAGPGSDLDFVVEFHQKSFDAYMGLKDYLEGLFGCRVDLVLPNTIKPRLKSVILGNLIDAA